MPRSTPAALSPVVAMAKSAPAASPAIQASQPTLPPHAPTQNRAPILAGAACKWNRQWNRFLSNLALLGPVLADRGEPGKRPKTQLPQGVWPKTLGQ